MAEEEGPPVELRQRKKPKSSENKESAKGEKISDIPIPERAPKRVYELTHNNKTVSLKTINAVQQMSLYPELIASVLYQATGSKEIIEPVYFYIGIVFGLQGIYVTALFVTSWLMSGTWLAGMLTVAWF
ncbi:DPY19L4 isoform 1, partial [Pongo abelii]